MKIFMLKCILLAALMFLSVLVGMQQANEGINNMRGYGDPEFKSGLSINEDKAAILGNDVSSHDLQQKREKLQEMKAFNFFSSIGKELADGISSGVKKTIESISGKTKDGQEE
ncbi:DUF3679 domain-containing protein [Bacillus sp. T33-2]|uniref:DUF3679 domain-containing protein n=1 Tax=Bacillus sp. T33-2 TaxID=2054168 RepID=UPI000C77D53C|nr:DUF3679 domain-containing protein [Bacillus sp. T33-2]PLR93805.1 DUF3679 domain-containing protein [Bacillus sp. T33-2]